MDASVLNHDLRQHGPVDAPPFRPEAPFRVVRLSPRSPECVFPIERTCLIYILDGRVNVTGDFGAVEARAGQIVSIKCTCDGRVIGNDRVDAFAVFLEHEYLVGLEYWAYAHAFTDRDHARNVIKYCDSDEAQLFDIGTDSLSRLRTLFVMMTRRHTIGRSHGLISTALSVLPERRCFLPAQGSEPTGARHGIRLEARHAARLLREHYRESWTLDRLGRHVNLSRAQLARVFVHGYGITPAQYLTGVRVERMAELLVRTSEPVSEVVRLAGWSDRGHATAVFTQRMRMTPRQFRASQRRA